MSDTFGGALRQLRLSQGKTLRQFCKEHGFNPGNWSRYERDRIPPPAEGVVWTWLIRFGVEEDSEGWYHITDLANVARSQMPYDLMSDAELVPKLPVLFGALRLDRDKLVDLAEIIRSA